MTYSTQNLSLSSKYAQRHGESRVYERAFYLEELR